MLIGGPCAMANLGSAHAPRWIAQPTRRLKRQEAVDLVLSQQLDCPLPLVAGFERVEGSVVSFLEQSITEAVACSSIPFLFPSP